jgi:hypothetical protein
MGAFLALLNPISAILDKVLPDKAANDAAKAQLITMQLNGDIQAQLAQIDVNKTEAAAQSIFVAGWRPFVGWTCGSGLAYSAIVQPFMQFLLVAFHSNFDPAKLPVINTTELITLLGGLLGLGAMRTVEKVQGVNAGH